MKAKLPSLSKIKKALYADWSLRVRTRDGFKCLLCGATENLTAHHWYCSDHHAHAARYSVDNGATLCYACHIRGIHTRADWLSVDRLRRVIGVSDLTMKTIDGLVGVELTTSVLRELWDAMRKRSIPVMAHEVKSNAGKLFAYVKGQQMAVPGNTVTLLTYKAYRGLFEVTTVAKTDTGYRYTLKEPEETK